MCQECMELSLIFWLLWKMNAGVEVFWGYAAKLVFSHACNFLWTVFKWSFLHKVPKQFFKWTPHICIFLNNVKLQHYHGPVERWFEDRNSSNLPYFLHSAHHKPSFLQVSTTHLFHCSSPRKMCRNIHLKWPDSCMLSEIYQTQDHSSEIISLVSEKEEQTDL